MFQQNIYSNLLNRQTYYWHKLDYDVSLNTSRLTPLSGITFRSLLSAITQSLGEQNLKNQRVASFLIGQRLTEVMVTIPALRAEVFLRCTVNIPLAIHDYSPAAATTKEQREVLLPTSVCDG